MLLRSPSLVLLLTLVILPARTPAEQTPLPLASESGPLAVATVAEKSEPTEKAEAQESAELLEKNSLPQDRPVQAKNLKLDKPLSEQELSALATANHPVSDNQSAIAVEASAVISPADEVAPQQLEENTLANPSADAVKENAKTVHASNTKVLRLLGSEVPPATSTRLAWSPSQHFEGVYSATPVLVVNGAEAGPTLCLMAAIHGDELNGIETVRRVVYNLNPKTLKGAVIGVPIVNLQGFHRSSRYLTDRRDLNRHFPGDANGSSAARIARSFFDEIVTHCNAIVDLHTGSFYRTNLPQLRGDLHDPKVVKMTKGFGSTVVLHSKGASGTLRSAAVNAGIPTVTLEAGAPMVLDEKSVNHSVKGIRTLLNQLDMVSKFRLWGDPEPVYYNSIWQRATTGGIIFSVVELGETVNKGDLLGTITNPITNVRKEIRSQYHGRILGMAMNQVVQPGFAAYHIGIQAPQEQISSPAQGIAEDELTAPPAQQAPPPALESEEEKGTDSVLPAAKPQALIE